MPIQNKTPTVVPVAAIRRQVYIEDGGIAEMAGNSKFIAEFPFLSQINSAGAQRRSCCGGGGEAAQAKSEVFNTVKLQFTGLSDDRKRLLKKMLNAEQVTIKYRSGNRQLQLTF